MGTDYLKVLLIEDNPGDVRLIREMLVDAKYASFTVDSVDRLRDGLARLTETDFDVVLLDLSLPDSIGLETFVTFHSAAEDLPIVVLSGLNDETTAVECVNAGAQDYLIKGDVTSQLLIRSLRYAVARGSLERERSQLLDRERSARSQAETANRAKDEFLAMVSHELRTPLSAMVGWARMLRSGKLDQITAERGMEAIERNARAQTKLIEDLLDISRITTGKLRLKTRPLELHPVINETVEAMRPAAQAKEISVQAELDETAGWISGDPDRLQQIIWNLLSNSIKFTPNGGRIDVKLRRVGSLVEITVSDTGQGISPEFLPYVFERFRQADGSVTRKHAGLGLGLSIVRYLVEHHGGVIDVESAGEGKGATFRLMFPMLVEYRGISEVAAADSSPHHEVTSVKEPCLQGLRILVVDDQADFRDVVTEILLQAKAEVLTVASSAEALEALELWDPDVMLADIEMPGEDGYSLLRKVRALDPKHGGLIPAVALTAYGRPEDRARALEASYQVYLSKPVDPHELKVVIASVARKGDVRTKATARLT